MGRVTGSPSWPVPGLVPLADYPRPDPLTSQVPRHVGAERTRSFTLCVFRRLTPEFNPALQPGSGVKRAAGVGKARGRMQ